MKFLLLALFTFASCTKERYEDAATLTDELLHELEKRLNTLDKGYALSEELSADVREFRKTENKIIKTSESLKAGATYLGSPELTTEQLCKKECLTNWTCNLAVFKEKAGETSCYLFNCQKPSVCSFVEHDGFSISELPERDTTRKEVSSEDDLEILAALKPKTTTVTSTTSTPQPTTTVTTTTVQTDPPRREPLPLFSECKDHKDCAGSSTQCLAGYCVCQESYHPQEGLCRPDCTKFQYECSNEGQPLSYPQCIAIYDKCDGIRHCHDGSDEEMCVKETSPDSEGRNDKLSNGGLVSDPVVPPAQKNPGKLTNLETYYDLPSSNRIMNPHNSPYYDSSNIPDMSYYESDYRGPNRDSSQIAGERSKSLPVANAQMSLYGPNGSGRVESEDTYSDGSSKGVYNKPDSNVKQQPARPVETDQQPQTQPANWNQPKIGNHVMPNGEENVDLPSTPEKTLHRIRPYPSTKTERPINPPKISAPENTGFQQGQHQQEEIHGYEGGYNQPHQIQRKPGVGNVRPNSEEDNNSRPSGNVQRTQISNGNQQLVQPKYQQSGPYDAKNIGNKGSGRNNPMAGKTEARQPSADDIAVNGEGSRERPGGYRNNYNNNGRLEQNQNPQSELYHVDSSPPVLKQHGNNNKPSSSQQGIQGGNYMNSGSGYRPLAENNRKGGYSMPAVVTTPPSYVKAVTSRPRVNQPAYKPSSSDGKPEDRSHHGYSTEGGIVRAGGSDDNHRKTNTWGDSGRNENSRLMPYSSSSRNNKYSQPNTDYSDNSVSRHGDSYWNSPYFSGSSNNNNNNKNGVLANNMYHYYDPPSEFPNRGYFPRQDYAYYNFDQGPQGYNPFVFGSSFNPSWESQKFQASARMNALGGGGSPQVQVPGNTEEQDSQKFDHESSGFMNRKPVPPTESHEKADRNDESTERPHVNQNIHGEMTNLKEELPRIGSEGHSKQEQSVVEQLSDESEEEQIPSDKDTGSSFKAEVTDKVTVAAPSTVKLPVKGDVDDGRGERPNETIEVIEVEENGSLVGVAVDDTMVGETDVAVVVQSNTGAVVALSLGLAITFLLLFFVGCRLRNVRKRLRRGRPMNTNEADYLINGMYL